MSRDDAVVRGALRRGAGRASAGMSTLRLGADGGVAGWGGARRLATPADLGPSRDDEVLATSVPGRYVPLGYARYAAPLVDPTHYSFYRAAGWRVAVPRSVTGAGLIDLLERIYFLGPAAAGYVRRGDTLVPAILGSGDRETVSEFAGEFYGYPLTP